MLSIPCIGFALLEDDGLCCFFGVSEVLLFCKFNTQAAYAAMLETVNSNLDGL